MTVVADVLTSPRSQTAALPRAHRHVPSSAAPLIVRSPQQIAALAAVFAAMALTVHWASGPLVQLVDHPIESWVIHHRTPTADAVVRRISFLGSSQVVYTLGPLLGLAALARCKIVGATVLAVTAARPLVEFTFKSLVGRPRPDIDRLVRGTGYSFPCGHVMAAAALWGMVPLVLSLYVSSRRVWRASAIASVAMIVMIGSTRVYLGVHWPSDVVAGAILDLLLLSLLDRAFHRVHDRYHCRASHP
ncbi:Membrane-associated phospholipid phosphatase [Frankia sp. AiPs1]|uniref:phosphatase PAP2 family protein n=1 Tax=Frankia sp. AiPa1 TaxID=573492 RepID=UPI00202B84A4|nr:phosphatase PAP2 family protein [Frankia sp. AiPa1]MCL9760895.1 phosphatase PAP2 family protein [Frankia sp. AiPa1]